MSWAISSACTCSRGSARRFEATITSALEFGLFVQLKEMPIDGLVHISAIPGEDYWELDSGGMGLVGRRTRPALADGRRGAVRLTRVDLTQRQIDFEFSMQAGPPPTGSGAGAAPQGGRASRGPGPGSATRRRAAGRSRRSARRAGKAVVAAAVAEPKRHSSTGCTPSAR